MKKNYLISLLSILLYAFTFASSTNTDPSIVITSLTEGQVLDAGTTSVLVEYEIRDFPGFTLGSDGSVVYRIEKNGDFIDARDGITDTSFTIDVQAGNQYSIELEILDTSLNPFSPAVISTRNFSIAPGPSINIYAPDDNEVFDAATTQVDISYDILNFSATIGTDAFVVFTLKENGDLVLSNNDIRDTTISTQVRAGYNYEATIELVDASGNSFTPAITSVKNYSVAAFPSINIFAPYDDEVFSTTTSRVEVAFDIIDFPNFTLGTDGTIVYTVKKNGDIVNITDDFTDTGFSVDVSAGNDYSVEIELVDTDRNSFNPAIKSTKNFSVVADPSVVITSLTQGQVLDANTTSMNVEYEIRDFPGFTVGSDGYLSYVVWKNGDIILEETNNSDIVFDVASGNSYTLEVELLDSGKDRFTPRIMTSVDFSVAAVTGNPSINIYAPEDGQVFDASTTNVDIAFDIIGFPSFTLGTDGTAVYTIRKNGDIVSITDDFTDTSFSVDVNAGNDYSVEIELVDTARNSFDPAIKATKTFSVAAAAPSVVISSPTDGQVFESGTTSVPFRYDILNFPDFNNIDGFISYSVKEDGDPNTTTEIAAAGVNIDWSVTAGNYFLEIEVLDENENSFSPAILASVNFSITESTSADPSVVITSLTQGQVLDANTTSMNVEYEIRDFPGFTVGADGYLSYIVWKNGDIILEETDNTDIVFDVASGNSYTLEVELLDSGKDRFTPRIMTSVDFSVAAVTGSPSINIFAPEDGQVFDASTTNVDIAFDIVDFPSFTLGTDGTAVYTVRKNGDVVSITDDFTDTNFSIDVNTGNDYSVEIELVDTARNSFDPAIKSTKIFSVAAAAPSVVISSPTDGQVFEAGTTSVPFRYDILNFPDFNNIDGFISYSVKKDDDPNTTTEIAAAGVNIDWSVTAGNYFLEIEVLDENKNSFSPAILATTNFSVAEAVGPSIVFTSPDMDTVFESNTTSVDVTYEIRDFPGFTLGSDGSIIYTIRKNGDIIDSGDNFTETNFNIDVSAGNEYRVEVELVDASSNPFTPEVRGDLVFYVADVVNPSIVFLTPDNDTVFDANTTNVDISYEIRDFPDFTLGTDGSVKYTVSKNGATEYIIDDVVETNFSVAVTENNAYQIEVELVDADRNSFNPAIKKSVFFSVASATPSVEIISPQQSESLSPSTTEVTVEYEIKNFPSFTPGSDGFVKYTVSKNGVTTIEEDNYIDIIFDVTAGSYTVEVELLDGAKEPFSPRILAATWFNISDTYREASSLEELGYSDRGEFYELINEITITYDTQNERNQKYIQDDSAGFIIDDVKNVLDGYNEGDVFTGLKGQYIEDAEGKKFIPEQEPTNVVSTGNTIPPTVLTLEELIDNIDEYQSQRVTIKNASFDAADGVARFDSSITRDYLISSGDLQMVFRLEFDGLDLEGTIIPQGTFDITGIAAKPATSSRRTSGLAQIFPTELSGITTSVKENTIEGFNVFPNPITKNGSLTITTASFEDKKVEIFNLLGKRVLVKNVTGNINNVTIEQLSSGMYVLKVTASGQIATKKLIIK
ncbi:T9SS type A sorting domain-containing protein [Tenacibaculum sp. M341]|uniref:T9SS type A sorting domain-containing protein n=1 Tax=Tenacibaculum sp. M341 TaxID=2530339 RepID=UPI0010536BE6|nr:T9SS type A sorting domain-containing protein [Tenacibaculum sp. M341]TCI84604.1 T9SS type A sorting domain-containing protein [Tenacibaculum sp. M341]